MRELRTSGSVGGGGDKLPRLPDWMKASWPYCSASSPEYPENRAISCHFAQFIRPCSMFNLVNPVEGVAEMQGWRDPAIWF